MSEGDRAAHSLVEFMAAMGLCTDEAAAMRVGIERAAEAFGAEMGLIIRAYEVVSSVGPLDRLSDDLNRSVTDRRQTTTDVAGFGRCVLIPVPLDAEGHTVLILGRLGEEIFSPEQAHLLRGMAHALHSSCTTLRLLDKERKLRAATELQAVENAKLLSSLRERQLFADRLSKIQRSISHRAPLHEVLGSITAAAADLLGDEVVALRIVDPSDRDWLVTVSSIGVPPDVQSEVYRTPVTKGMGARAYREGRLIIDEDYGGSADTLDGMRELNIQAAMAAPVCEDGKPVGCLIVSSVRLGRRYSQIERDVLEAFAEHVSLALTDAHTVDAMNHAYQDSLTGLANRALFLERVEQASVRNRRRQTSFALLYLDVDHFKVINDSMGHTAGDELLVEIGQRIRASLRRDDFAGRLGGDEFAVLAEGITSPEDAFEVARRLQAAFESPFLLQGRAVVTTASIGVAMYDGGGQGADELLRNADVAMYRAKSGGQGRFVIFEESMFAAARERMELDSDLRRAIDREELRVYFQPVIDLTTQDIRGVEALVRWQHPVRGFLQPLEFIPVAEETGVITRLDRWVLRESLRVLAGLQQRFPMDPPLHVAVNLSGQHFREGEQDIVAEVREALDASGVASESLVLEVTESVLLDHRDATVAAFTKLKAMGCRLAIDDFGAGYSSLTYLTMCDFDILKIDRAFIGSMVGTPIAEAILAMAKILDLETVAEGVENIHQVARLRELGCPLAQGFYFARPLPLHDLAVLLENQRASHGGSDVIIPLRSNRRG